MKRRSRKPTHRKAPRWTVVVRRNARGQLEVTLPAEVATELGPLGARVWFAVRQGRIEVSHRPRGPRPIQGRRTTRTRRPPGRPSGSRHVRRR
jgi:hypothetical protein